MSNSHKTATPLGRLATSGLKAECVGNKLLYPLGLWGLTLGFHKMERKWKWNGKVSLNLQVFVSIVSLAAGSLSLLLARLLLYLDLE